MLVKGITEIAVRDLSQANKALKDDLISHGLIGA